MSSQYYRSESKGKKKGARYRDDDDPGDDPNPPAETVYEKSDYSEEEQEMDSRSSRRDPSIPRTMRPVYENRSPSRSGSVAPLQNYQPISNATYGRQSHPDTLRRGSSIEPTRLAGYSHAALTPSVQPPSTNSSDDAPIEMVPVAAAFIKLPFDDFKNCAIFVDKRSDVLDVKTDPIQQAAIRAFMKGQNDIAARCLQRLLIIKRCEGRTVDESCQYIKELASRGSRFRDFTEMYEKLKTAIKAQVDTRLAQSGQLRNIAIAGSTTRESAIADQMGGLAIDNTQTARTRRTSSQDQPTPLLGKAQINRRLSVSQYPQSATLFESKDSGPVTLDRIQQRPGTLGIRPQSTAPHKSSLNSLDPNYWVRSRPEDFFTLGRVFKVLWHAPTGANVRGVVDSRQTSRGLFGEPIYSTLRWMMVVRQKQGYCICCPISTYGGKGLCEKAFSKAEIDAHAITYATDAAPTSLPKEPKMSKIPIPIRLEPDVRRVDPASRVHFGKYHTIEYNVKVMDIGKVPKSYLDHVLDYSTHEFQVMLAQR